DAVGGPGEENGLFHDVGGLLVEFRPRGLKAQMSNQTARGEPKEKQDFDIVIETRAFYDKIDCYVAGELGYKPTN
ncbi:MAG: hypothetical protein AAF585_18615, partial [Verrucomicrobiota bacterium]